MYILAIDTSCDDTSAAVAKDTTVLSNVISSQTALHKKWGGVVPNLARRAHEQRIDGVVERALKLAKISVDQIDVFAVTQGPGLAIALGVGISKAKELATKYNKPLIAVNHMEGHIYSNFVEPGRTQQITFPLLALLVSGGHTELVFMRDHGQYEKLGETLDDAAGEAFDKVARMIGLGYPGGAALAKVAETGNPNAYDLPVPLTKVKDLNFSYSGIKTAMHRLVKELTNDGTTPLSKKQIEDIAASFQNVAIKHLVQRTKRAVEQTGVKTLLIGGGVSANLELRKELRSALKEFGLTVFYPRSKKLCQDNAAMIAEVAFYKAKRLEFASIIDTERSPSMDF
ncbi:MAG TPA: tRNA (adenosine(37)-N6)-threonylcarbamoyltransferase complex transferase subunit TsaD [Candidatus Saccharimonadia bacterium]|nr:tRNA (adenosine(37)-N6)-threonylcarbamoyltransferase complex transferase subunit TsaD [Candidatus Saccharimonadia bacterium]